MRIEMYCTPRTCRPSNTCPLRDLLSVRNGFGILIIKKTSSPLFRATYIADPDNGLEKHGTGIHHRYLLKAEKEWCEVGTEMWEQM